MPGAASVTIGSQFQTNPGRYWHGPNSEVTGETPSVGHFVTQSAL